MYSVFVCVEINGSVEYINNDSTLYSYHQTISSAADNSVENIRKFNAFIDLLTLANIHRTR